jgi:hypothetical protein
MKNYEIIDNFLPKEDHDFMVRVILGEPEFPFYLKHGVSYLNNSKDGCYFTHLFFNIDKGESYSFFMLKPILDRIKPVGLLRSQCNLYSKTFFRKRHSMHTDFEQNHKGILYYLNDNNGFTILHDGTKIKSVANRALLFNPSLPHCSTTCTDALYRSNIIINYV